MKITADSNTGNEKLDAAIDTLNDDFSYVIAGLEKLARSGASSQQDAQVIAENLETNIQEAISQIADVV